MSPTSSRPERWRAVFGRAGQLDGRAAAVTVSGLLDSGIGILAPGTQELLVETAVRWGDHSVRRRAIGLVAERRGAEAAHAIAARDPNAGVRAWAASLLAPDASETRSHKVTKSQPPAKAKKPESPTLF